MKVLTYVNGTLTLIADNKDYIGPYVKPSFITGDNFYYEPTLKMMDGKDLTQELIDEAERFISEFVVAVPEFLVESQYVDENGNYIGFEGTIKLPEGVMPEEGKYFDGVEFVEGVLVDGVTGEYRGEGDTRTSIGTKYGPKATLPTMFGAPRYVYDFERKVWTITLEQARACKIDKLGKVLREETEALIGPRGYLEVTSFTKQENEARAWLLDNSQLTPFIDNLLLTRHAGETKAELVAKIIRGADAFNTEYAKVLGKYHRGSKLVELAMTPEEVYDISWEKL